MLVPVDIEPVCETGFRVPGLPGYSSLRFAEGRWEGFNSGIKLTSVHLRLACPRTHPPT